MKRTLYLLRRNTLAMVGLGIVILFGVIAVYSVFVPVPGDRLVLYCGTSPNAAPSSGCTPVCTYVQGTAPPSPSCYPVPLNGYGLVAPTINLQHLSGGPLPLGSMSVNPGDQLFYSVYQGLLKGAAWSLSISVAIVASGAMIGFVLGAISGYRGGLTDEFIMRITDIFLSIPGLLLVIVFLAVFGTYVTDLTTRVYILVAGFVITWWPLYARLVRSQVLITREQKFVEAAKASGAKTGRILRKHIMPNAVFPVFVQVSLDVGTIPLLIGAIVFLGYHIFPTQFFPEWGTMAAIPASNLQPLLSYCSIQALSNQSCVFPWWQFFFPGLALFLFAIAVNFLSDGLRDALDPRLRR